MKFLLTVTKNTHFVQHLSSTWFWCKHDFYKKKNSHWFTFKGKLQKKLIFYRRIYYQNNPLYPLLPLPNPINLIGNCPLREIFFPKPALAVDIAADTSVVALLLLSWNTVWCNQIGTVLGEMTSWTTLTLHIGWSHIKGIVFDVSKKYFQ